MSEPFKIPGWKDMPIGMDIDEPGCARRNRTGDWRSERPIWDEAKCVQCGVCTVFCPEGCVRMDDRGFPSVDLEYCKGCGICVNECVTGCIRMQMEVE